MRGLRAGSKAAALVKHGGVVRGCRPIPAPRWREDDNDDGDAIKLVGHADPLDLHSLMGALNMVTEGP